MTIEWGEPIEVGGVRPEWLRDDERIRWASKDGREPARMGWGWWTCGLSPYGSITVEQLNWTEAVGLIRLPASHPYYLASAEGFTYWPGGDQAPEDWGRDEVLLRDGTLGFGNIWLHYHGNDDIIGYRKRTTIVVSAQPIGTTTVSPQPIGSATLDPEILRLRARVDELLNANNREVERRRAAEATLRAVREALG